MGVGAGTGELRLNWSARGLAYLLSKHGIEGLHPVTRHDENAASRAANHRRRD